VGITAGETASESQANSTVEVVGLVCEEGGRMRAECHERKIDK